MFLVLANVVGKYIIYIPWKWSWNGEINDLKMYHDVSPIKMMVFHCYFTLPEGKYVGKYNSPNWVFMGVLNFKSVK